jgi:fructose-1,6-bisphosphatase/inositol monophosphatase family enzyme
MNRSDKSILNSIASPVTERILYIGAYVSTPNIQTAAAQSAQTKTTGELVSSVDVFVEQYLHRTLTEILPGSVAVGEETVGSEDSLLSLLSGPRPIWLIDPLDGTKSYIEQSTDYSILVSLVFRQQILASWTYGPKSRTMATAILGQGAYINNSKVLHRPHQQSTQHPRVVIVCPEYWSERHRTLFGGQLGRRAMVSTRDSSGLRFAEILSGQFDALIMPWDFPWDYAAGLLLIQEGGGHIMELNGRVPSILGGNSPPLVTATSRELAQRLVNWMTASL